MRKISLIERVRLFGRSGIDVLAVLGRSTLFLFHALLDAAASAAVSAC